VKQFAGEADYGAETVSINKLSLYKQNEANGNYNLRLGEIHRTSGVVYLNQTLEDESWRQVVSDLRFRQALNMAIDRQEVIDAVYFGQAEPSTLNPNEYNPGKAKNLLDEMGMTKRDSAGFRLALDGKSFSIEIEPHTGFFDMMPAAELYAEFWNTVGVKTTIKNEDSGLWGQRLGANEQQSTVLFDVSTLWYYQSYSPDIWAPLWNNWWNSNGEAGEEPPANVKTFYEKVASIMVVPPSEGRKVSLEVEKMLYDNLWYFIPSIHQKQARIENKTLGNMTNNGSAFSIAQTLSMEQAYFKQ
jgi:peptide/nickel transport system substrate-binding protein